MLSMRHHLYVNSCIKYVLDPSDRVGVRVTIYLLLEYVIKISKLQVYVIVYRLN